MMPLFNLVRYIIYGTVIAWTVIVLGVAGFLDHILVASDLTRFVPLAIFVASTTLFILIALLIFGVLRSSMLASQTRSELAAVGLLGILWLVLGIYTSTQELADVECDDDISYDTSTYHAQYHVLQAFSIFNTILLWSFLFFFLFLSLRHHFAGRREVWTSKAVDYPWFGPAKTIAAQQTARSKSQNQNKGKSGFGGSGGLPLPVTAKEKGVHRSGSGGSGRYAHGHGHGRHGSGDRREKHHGTGPRVVPPEVPTKGGHTYVVFIPPAANNNAKLQNQIYPSRR